MIKKENIDTLREYSKKSNPFTKYTINLIKGKNVKKIGCYYLSSSLDVVFYFHIGVFTKTLELICINFDKSQIDDVIKEHIVNYYNENYKTEKYYKIEVRTAKNGILYQFLNLNGLQFDCIKKAFESEEDLKLITAIVNGYIGE